MQFSLAILSAIVATAACTPLAMPPAFSGTLEARQDSNCTEYCSVSAGCVCIQRPSDCTATYLVQPGDTCGIIANIYNNFTITQFYRWNPDIGRSCFGLQAYVPVCINTPWYKFTPPVQPDAGTHYTPDQTPVPLMPNIISTCEDFELVGSGQRVEELEEENGITLEQFADWNGNATGTWADYWACVKA